MPIGYIVVNNIDSKIRTGAVTFILRMPTVEDSSSALACVWTETCRAYSMLMFTGKVQDSERQRVMRIILSNKLPQDCNEDVEVVEGVEEHEDDHCA